MDRFYNHKEMDQNKSWQLRVSHVRKIAKTSLKNAEFYSFLHRCLFLDRKYYWNIKGNLSATFSSKQLDR